MFATAHWPSKSHESFSASLPVCWIMLYCSWNMTGMIYYLKTHTHAHTQILSGSVKLRTHRLVICLYSWNYTPFSKSSQRALLYEKVSVTSGAEPGCYYSATFDRYDCLSSPGRLGVRATRYPRSLIICCRVSNFQCQWRGSTLNGGSLSSSDNRSTSTEPQTTQP